MNKAHSTIIDAAVLRKPKQRRVFRKSGTDNAAALIGRLSDGDEICGIANGQFSLVDIIEHILNEIGPSDIGISTWTMGIYDIDRAMAFTANGLIKKIRFMLDPSMFSRRPELSSILLRGFGIGSFRAVNTHAKFATLRSDRLAVAVRSSMNLNPNSRIENFDISVCDETTAFFEDMMNVVWNRISEKSRTQSEQVFMKLFDATPASAARHMPNPWINAAT